MCVCVRVLFIASMHEHVYICALRIILSHSSTILTDLEFLNLAQSSLMWFWRSRLRSSHSHGKGFPHWTTRPAWKSSLTLVCSVQPEPSTQVHPCVLLPSCTLSLSCHLGRVPSTGPSSSEAPGSAEASHPQVPPSAPLSVAITPHLSSFQDLFTFPPLFSVF